MTLLPWNFEQLPSGSYFLSNLAGFHIVVDTESFHELITDSVISNELAARTLEHRFFFTRDRQEDIGLAAISSGFAKRLLGELAFRPVFMIVPTLRCDHECVYCQVSRASERAKGYDLHVSYIPKILEAIKRLGDPPYQLEIQGGEPLLRFDLIERIYDEACQILGSSSFSMVIASSLSLLNDDVLTWAKDRNVQFSVSLDGTRSIHNRDRILPQGDSFARVQEAVQRIQATLGCGRVATVTTVTDALLGNPRDIIEAHLELGLTDMFVRPVSPFGFAHTQIPTYRMDAYLTFYAALFEYILDYNRRGIRVVEHSAAIHMKRLLMVNYSSYADLKSPSGYMLNSIVFNYDGRVFGSDEARMIQRVHKEIDLSCGTLDGHIISRNDLTAHIMSSSFSFDTPGCAECAYQPFCGADPCQSISLFGEPVGDKSRSPFCQYHKGMFNFLIERLYSDPESAALLTEWAHA